MCSRSVPALKFVILYEFSDITLVFANHQVTQDNLNQHKIRRAKGEDEFYKRNGLERP